MRSMGARERFVRFGPDRLGDSELLALVMGAGEGASAATARALLAHFGDLSVLATAQPVDLTALPGLGRARAVQVLAALQAGRRSLLPSQRQPLILTPADAHAEVYARLSGRREEVLCAMYLNRRRALLETAELTVGNDAHTIVDPRQVYARALRAGAAGVIVAHNHPSGEPEPSAEDLMVTRRLADAGALLGVPLLDHIVVGAGRFVSLHERGLLVRAHALPPIMRA